MPARFPAKIALPGTPDAISPANCRIWIGAMHRNGFPVIKQDGKSEPAHRVCYEITTGKIPPRYYVTQTRPELRASTPTIGKRSCPAI